MVRLLRQVLVVLAAAILLAKPGWAQTRAVDPSDLSLTVTVESLPETLMRQEMILLTIHGVYKRHITREQLEQPDLTGFNWMQLGQDDWYESMLDGLPVKNMRRRMAVFPDKAGRLEIGAFQHRLTLLDEDNKWFEHTVKSDPLTLDVAPELAVEGWWFPVRRLQVADNWSNAPDQLAQGAGVLRVVRVSALGASPDMIPPMPELKSPSALIFAHPEKRLVDLTPRGPEAIAYWRWTVTPTNGNAAILEPISFSYFDTVAREMRNVAISAQRVAFGDVTGSARQTEPVAILESGQRPALLAIAGFAAFASAIFALLYGRSMSLAPLKAGIKRQRLLWRFDRAARREDSAALRRTAHALDAIHAPSVERRALLSQLDSALFGRIPDQSKQPAISRSFRYSLASAPPR
jgi:hypothetical protein